jgi:hypothetical protein
MNIPHLRLWCSKDKVKRVRQLVHVFCIFNFQDVTDRELDLLCEIIYHKGVNTNAKNSFMLNYKTSAANYGQVIKRLADKGILVNKEFNGLYQQRTGKLLHKDFEALMTHFVIDEDMRMLAVIVP